LFFNEKFNPSKQYLDPWTESTKVTDYLKQVRMKTIEELKKAQDDTLQYYSLNSARFKSELTNIEELRSELFADKFYFQVQLKQSKKRIWAFNVFTFVTE
jgi:DNA repair ATPase RecN